ncbi:MAG: PilZ domain-containing protein [Desulfobacterales bacterium]|nr:PilZ domain-containing protein [Desulfobacterales bacterium]
MNEDSIDFQPIPENTENTQIRHLFRTPVSLSDNIQVKLGENEYLVTNLSETGIAVNVSSCLEFESGHIIKDAWLRIGDVNITGLCAKVIHCSVNDSGSFQIGFQWVNISSENRETLRNALGQLKVKALEVKDLFEEPPEG